MERQSLYAAICAGPRDDLPKLVFADWLDEHGDHVDRAHAELIRIQCEWDSDALVNLRLVEPYRLDFNRPHWPDPALIATHDPQAARAIQLLSRSTELEPLTKTRPVMPLPEVNGAAYRYVGPVKGLRNGLRIKLAPTWYKRLSELRSRLPIRHVVTDIQEGRPDPARVPSPVEMDVLTHIESLTSWHPVPDLALEILASPHSGHLRRVTLPYSNAGDMRLNETLSRAEHLSELDELELGNFCRWHDCIPLPSDRLRQLRRLSLGGGDPYSFDPVLLQFAEAANNRLEVLSLVNVAQTDAIALSLTFSTFPQLVELNLGDSVLTGRGATDLLTGNFPELRQLNVSNNRLVDFVGKTLEKTFQYPRLHSLDVSFCQFSPSAIASLTRWPGFAHLRKLVLNGNPLNHQALAALGSADAPNLRTLGLANCHLHGSHVRELVTSRFVRSLWLLDLRANFYDDAFVRALIETPFLDALQCLLLDVPEESPDYLRLKARFCDRFQSA